MKNKICPILLNGYLSNSKIDVRKAITSINNMDEWNLPQCLKENCALWVFPYLGSEGYCGLMKKRENQ